MASRIEREDTDDDRPRRPRRNDDDENRPRRARRDEEDEDRPRRSKKDDDENEDADQPRRRSRVDDEDRPRRRSRADDDDDRTIRKKRRKKKRRAFSITEAIPLDLSVQHSIGALLGLACFIGAYLGKIDVLYFPGVFFCVWGCMALAKKNGRSEMFGLLGLFGPVGFGFTLVLAKPKD